MSEETKSIMPEGDTSQRPQRGRRKEFIGVVVSDRMQKTIIVRVDRREPHPLYKKSVREIQ
jgi:small subunit ribosomal protein S17